MKSSHTKLTPFRPTTWSRLASVCIWIVSTLAIGSGCDQIRSYLQPPEHEPRTEERAEEPGAVNSEQGPASPQVNRRELPLPHVDLGVEPGSLVLAPRQQRQVNSIADGFLSHTLYDIQRIARIEDGQVYLETPLDEERAVPAALALPLTTQSSATAGDRVVVPAAGRLAVGIVRESSRRTQTAIVRSQRMQIRRELKPGHYYLVDPGSNVGHFAFCNTGSRDETFLIMRETEDVYVAIAPQGAVSVFSHSECHTLPLEPSVRTGDTVRAELLGNIREASIETVNRSEEFVEVTYAWRDTVRNQRLSYGLFDPVVAEDDEDSDEQPNE